MPRPTVDKMPSEDIAVGLVERALGNEDEICPVLGRAHVLGRAQGRAFERVIMREADPEYPTGDAATRTEAHVAGALAVDAPFASEPVGGASQAK